MELAVFQLRVGQRLGVVPTAGTLSAEDGELVLGAYENLIHELLEHGLAWWNADEAVPDKYADCLIGMTAAALVDEFTIPEPRRSQLLVQGKFGMAPVSMDERRLRALTAAPAADVGVADYY